MKQIAVKISDQAHDRLQRLAHKQHTNYAMIIEAALSAYEPSASCSSEASNEIQMLIDTALQPVLERLAILESPGLVSPYNAPESAVVAEEGLAEGGAEIGSCAVTGPLVEEQGGILPDRPPNPRKFTVKEFIAGLVASGERSPTAIARALSDAGYRTGTGSEFKRSNPQIKAALDAVRGK